MDYLMNESSRIFNTRSISGRIRTVKRQVERKVWEFFLYFQEIFQIEHFVQGTRAIEVRHLTIRSLQRLRHVHDLGTQRSHTSTTTNPHHLSLRIENWVEITIRTTHSHLITRFQRKDIRRSDTRHHIHETNLWFRFERRRSDTHGQHDTVTLSRIVSHRIGTDRR